MSESEFIWKFLNREYHNEHPAIYLYVIGNVQSKQNAIDKIMRLVRSIFTPPYSEGFLLTIVKAFLESKRKQYIKGEIKVKALY